MSKIFKPRRGTSTVMSGSKATTVLAAGEMFVEFDTTVGGGAASVKFGDGSTQYSALPYAIKSASGTNVSNAEITITSDSSVTSTAALNNVSTGTALGSIVGSLKQAISLTKSELTDTIDGRLNTNNIGFYFDYQSGEYGWNSSSARGADTFHPFSSSGIELVYTNTASSHSYSGFNITVDMSNYIAAIVSWKNVYGNATSFGPSYCTKNSTVNSGICFINSGSSKGLACYRPITVEDSKITFGKHLCSDGTTLTTLNNYNLLDKIYGIK